MEVVLDNIRSLHNVGSIFRTADALGIETIYLCGYTPTPYDRGGNLRPQFSKVALGSELNVSWEKHPQAWRLIENLKKAMEKAREEKVRSWAWLWTKRAITSRTLSNAATTRSFRTHNAA